MWVKSAGGVVVATVMIRRGFCLALPRSYLCPRCGIVMFVGLKCHTAAVFQQPRAGHRHQFDRLRVLRQTGDRVSQPMGQRGTNPYHHVSLRKRAGL